MGEKQAIEISQRITLHNSLPTVKVNKLKERHVSAKIPCKMSKDFVAFECLLFFVLVQRISMYHCV